MRPDVTELEAAQQVIADLQMALHAARTQLDAYAETAKRIHVCIDELLECEAVLKESGVSA